MTAADDLRARAEAALRADVHGDAIREGDLVRLVHELEVHQIELELQNQELRGAQQELERERQRYFDLFDLSPVPYAIVDSEGVIKEANLALADLLRVPRIQLIDRRLSRFVHPEDAAAFQLLRRDLFGAGIDRRPTLRFVVPGGDPVTAYVDAAGQAEGADTALLAIVDVSELERQRELVRRQADRIGVILETAIDGIIAIDRGGVIEALNPAALSMFGYEERELIGSDFGLLVPARYRDEYAAQLERLLGTRRALYGLRKDGSEFPVDIGLSKSREGDRVIGVLRDLTEQRALEEQLRRAQRMEAIGRLASGVAHDFNNLLMGISGCADIAQQRIAAGEDPQRFLDAIRESARTGAADTRRLLAIGRGGRQRLVDVSLDETLQNAVPVLRRFIGEDIDLKVRRRAGDCRVRVPEGSLEQALINLAANARDAMPEGGVLTIETGRAGDRVEMTVADTGCGMDEGTRALAFEPFYTTKPPGKGTGLGLSTLYGVVKQSGGEVELISELGRGTTVRIALPVASTPIADEPDAASPAAATQSGRGRCVLVVEDESLVRFAIRHYLEDAGYRVVEAATAAAALERANESRVDLVLTDVVLPGGGGRALVEALRERQPGIAAVYMSAHSADQLHRSGHIEPGAPSLQKPFPREDVLAIVAHALAARESDA